MSGDVVLDVLAGDVVRYEGAIGEGEVGKGHGDRGYIRTMSVRIIEYGE